MKQGIFEITAHRPLTQTVYEMKLNGDTSEITAPGQFVNLQLDGKFLRRPISVCDCVGDTLTLVYKVVGGGTKQMSEMQVGASVDILTGLGNGYDLAPCRENALLLGGGVGVPPLYMLCKQLLAERKRVHVVLGFGTKAEVFYEAEFRALGADVTVTTVDGSYGVRGFVTDAIADIPYDYFYTCGPEPMLRAVFAKCATEGQFSFEERMGCGFGACMGCSCKTVTGYKRICKEGPVLRREEILWQK